MQGVKQGEVLSLPATAQVSSSAKLAEFRDLYGGRAKDFGAFSGSWTLFGVLQHILLDHSSLDDSADLHQLPHER